MLSDRHSDRNEMKKASSFTMKERPALLPPSIPFEQDKERKRSDSKNSGAGGKTPKFILRKITNRDQPKSLIVSKQTS